MVSTFFRTVVIKMRRTVGIIGGMGPLATVDLMEKIIQFTPAGKDQDHIHIICDDYPQIPDRTAAIMMKGENPSPYLIESARRLERAGADILVIACNTAHYFYDTIQHSVKIPVIHMPKEVADYIKANHYKTVGLIATNGTLKTDLYQQNFKAEGIQFILPDPELQQKVMQGIYSIKAGDLKQGSSIISTVAVNLVSLGVEVIVAGCTEVPLVLKTSKNWKVIDSTEVAAKKVVQECLSDCAVAGR